MFATSKIGLNVLRAAAIYCATALALCLPIAVQADDCSQGKYSRLDISMENVPTIPRHDQPIGRSKITLRSVADGSQIASMSYDGRWFCISYNQTSKTYILGGVFEQGAWLTLGSIQYLREDGQVTPSAFDHAEQFAMAIVASPNGRYIAYVGGNRYPDSLYALDTQRDVLKKLGRPPSPPPLGENSSDDICAGERFVWGSCWADNYVELDAGIMRFSSDDVLVVNYGNDSPRKRGTRRHLRRYLVN